MLVRDTENDKQQASDKKPVYKTKLKVFCYCYITLCDKPFEEMSTQHRSTIEQELSAPRLSVVTNELEKCVYIFETYG